MSELKSYRMVDEDYCDNVLNVVPSDVYLKSEADEVIKKLNMRVRAEREAKVNYKISANDLSDGLKDAYSEIRHHKYRRCIRIISGIKAAMDNAFFVSEEHLAWLRKWHERWLQLLPYVQPQTQKRT